MHRTIWVRTSLVSHGSQAARRTVLVPGHRPIAEAEKLAVARLGGIPVRHDQTAVVANIYRAASTARQHLENSVPVESVEHGPADDLPVRQFGVHGRQQPPGRARPQG